MQDKAPGVQGLIQLGRNAIDRGAELESENARLKRKVNALLDAIGEHASKAAGRRIIAAMKAELKESGDAGG